MATNPMLEALSDLFDEDLVPGIDDRFPEIDQTYSQVVMSNESVVQDELTKEYKAIHTFVTSIAGALRSGSPLGPEMLANTGAAEVINAHDGYPGVADIPLPGLQNRYIKIAKLRGNITMNTAILRANQLKTVGDYPALILTQTAKNIAHQTAVAWYINDSAQVIKLDLTGAGAASTRSGHVVTLTGPTANQVFREGRYRRMLPGLQYDIWASGMGTCYTQNGWAMLTSQVDMYDPDSCTLYFQSEADATTFQAAAVGVAADFWLVPYSAIANRAASGTNNSILPCGYLSWLRATGTLFGSQFGDLNVASWGSLFKSYVVSIAGTLTETELNTRIKNFQEATGVMLDTIVLTNGILVNLLDSYGADASTSLVTYPQDPGTAMDRQLGWERLGYRYNGKIYAIHTSEFLSSNEAIVIKAGEGNLIRYEPPKVPGTDASLSGYSPRLEWLGKQFYDNIWMPSTAPGGGKTDGMEAPFDMLFQHAAREPRGIRMTNVSET